MELLTPAHSRSEPTAVHSRSLLSIPHFPAPVPTCPRRHVSQVWAHVTVRGPSVCTSLRPACYRLADGLSSKPLKLPSVPADLPTYKGASPDVGTFLLPLPPRGLGQSRFLYSFSFCHPIWLCRGFSCPFKYPMSLLLFSFSRNSVRIFPLVDVLSTCL